MGGRGDEEVIDTDGGEGGGEVEEEGRCWCVNTWGSSPECSGWSTTHEGLRLLGPDCVEAVVLSGLKEGCGILSGLFQW